jgi:hypothetical protein
MCSVLARSLEREPRRPACWERSQHHSSRYIVAAVEQLPWMLSWRLMVLRYSLSQCYKRVSSIPSSPLAWPDE